MEQQTTHIEVLFEKAGQYAKTSVELYKLKTIDRSAEVIASLTARMFIVLLFTLFFLILNVGISLWIGELLGKTYYGFFIVSGFYALGALVLYAFREKWIKTPVKNSIILQALN